jgi:hypothetical protein
MSSPVGEDINMGLPVDTFMPSWRVWLYAEDIGAEHGPLTFVPGSQRNTEQKLRWLH